MWSQNYDPLHSHFWSTVEAALPVVILLAYIASNIFRPHHAALVSLLIANIIATMIFQLPVSVASVASVFGAITGFFTIGWIVLNVFFLYRLTIVTGSFEMFQQMVETITKDRRIQLLLIAFAFGSFFEGATAFGTPVAITGAILIGLGFSPLASSALSLIANTTAVGYAAFGAPELALKTSMGLDPDLIGAMIGRQVSVFSVIIPFWLIFVFAGWRGMIEILPAILVTGVSFGLSQFVVSNYFNFWSVSMVSSLISLSCLILLLQIWQPAKIWRTTAMRHHNPYAVNGDGTSDESRTRLDLSNA
ncbi:MAG: L-lactate permease, partial [Alphaproteobacteria bacterium]|nr:L-lactate permease [Alphaproteobacteria bacterium]